MGRLEGPSECWHGAGGTWRGGNNACKALGKVHMCYKHALCPAGLGGPAEAGRAHGDTTPSSTILGASTT